MDELEPNGEAERAEERVGGRGITAIILALIAALVLSLSVSTIWMHRTIFDTDTFVETLAPLPKDPAISTAIAMHAVEAFEQNRDVQSRMAEALPEGLGFLAPVLTDYIADFVFEIAQRVVESDAVTALWTAALRVTHTVVIAVLEGGPIADGDVISVELDGIGEMIKEALNDRGLNLVEEIEASSFGQIVLAQAEALAAPRAIVDVLHTVVWLLPVVMLLFLGTAVLIDRDRFRPLQWYGFAGAIVILVQLVVLRVVESNVVGSKENPYDQAAAEAVWNTLLNGYLWITLAVALIAAAIGGGAWWYRRPAESSK